MYIKNMAKIVSVITGTHDVTDLRHYRGHILHTQIKHKNMHSWLLLLSDEYTKRHHLQNKFT